MMKGKVVVRVMNAVMMETVVEGIQTVVNPLESKKMSPSLLGGLI